MATYSDFVQEACWKTHEQRGMKMKGGKMVPNCVRKGTVSENNEWWVEMFREDMEEKRRIAAERKKARVARGGKGDEGSTGSHFEQDKDKKRRAELATPQRVTPKVSSNVRHQGSKEKNRRARRQPGQLVTDPKRAEASRAQRAGKSYEGRQKSSPKTRGGALATTSKVTPTTPKGGAIQKSSSSITRSKGGALANRDLPKGYQKPKPNATTGYMTAPDTTTRKKRRPSYTPDEAKRDATKIARTIGDTVNALGGAFDISKSKTKQKYEDKHKKSTAKQVSYAGGKQSS